MIWPLLEGHGMQSQKDTIDNNANFEQGHTRVDKKKCHLIWRRNDATLPTQKKYKRAPIVTDRYRTTYWKYLNMDFLFKFDDNKDNLDMPSWDAPLL